MAANMHQIVKTKQVGRRKSNDHFERSEKSHVTGIDAKSEKKVFPFG